ncbi:hypothetical protein [Limnohabitans sp. G3-2]|uniref:hypothetical protein n=1 Tax=Limnohabitans sp. G3-2 TaxID=1100711 RepID=UPI001E48B164|nr:hypothetical protein [Limnohabitans sp. G3-2]
MRGSRVQHPLLGHGGFRGSGALDEGASGAGVARSIGHSFRRAWDNAAISVNQWGTVKELIQELWRYLQFLHLSEHRFPLWLTAWAAFDIFKISIHTKGLAMTAATAQIAFRYRSQDSATGVTRTTAKRLAEVLGVDETQVIHLALHELATKFLPQYEADEGALTKAQLSQVKKSAPKAKGGTVRSSLFELESA